MQTFASSHSWSWSSRLSAGNVVRILLLLHAVQAAQSTCFLAPQCDCSNSISNLIQIDCTNLLLQTMPTIRYTNYAIYGIDLSSNSITGLPSSWFSIYFTSVQYVSILNNPLFSITSDAFSGTTISQLFISYKSTSSSATPAFSWTAITPILSTLVNLTVSGYYVPTLSQSALTNAPNLRSLVLSNNQISSIASGSFAGLISLTYLDLSSNYFSAVPINIMSQLPALNTLKLSNNRIWTVALNSLPVRGLSYLDLSWNLIQQIQLGAFQSNLANLSYLDLTKNYLSDSSIPGLSGFSALQTLKLGMNQFVQVANVLSQCCKASPLWYLDIQGNHITELSSNSFSSIAASLGTLILNDNVGLNSMSNNTFVNLSNLTTLQASGIPWATVLQQSPVIFSSAPNLSQNLTSLYLDDATITTAALQSISTLTSLTTLSLQYNLIQAIPAFYFSQFSRLQMLSLNTNSQLNTIDSSSIYGLQSLQTFDLSYTSVSNISVCVTLWLPSLRNIQLANAPLTCDCNLLWLKTWAATQASANNAQTGGEYLCSSPLALVGQYVQSIAASQFNCSAGQTVQNLSACADVDAIFLQNATIPFSFLSVSGVAINVSVLVPTFAPYSSQIQSVYATAITSSGSQSFNSSASPPQTNLSLQISVAQSGNYQICIVMVTAHGSVVQNPANCVNTSLIQLALPATASITVIVVSVVCGFVVIVAVVIIIVWLWWRRRRAKRSMGDPFKINQPTNEDLNRINDGGTRFVKRPPRAQNGNGSLVIADASNGNAMNGTEVHSTTPALPGHVLYENHVAPQRPPRSPTIYDNRAFSTDSLAEDKSAVYYGAKNFANTQSTVTVDTHESIPLPRRPQFLNPGSHDRPDTTYTTYEELPDDRIYTNSAYLPDSGDSNAKKRSHYAPNNSKYYSPHSLTVPANGTQMDERTQTWNESTQPAPAVAVAPTDKPTEDHVYEAVQHTQAAAV